MSKRKVFLLDPGATGQSRIADVEILANHMEASVCRQKRTLNWAVGSDGPGHLCAKIRTTLQGANSHALDQKLGGALGQTIDCLARSGAATNNDYSYYSYYCCIALYTLLYLLYYILVLSQIMYVTKCGS